MIAYSSATIIAIEKTRPDIEEVIVDAGDGSRQKAVCYTSLIGSVETGDRVVINTTAVDLGLGTGGYHFVVWNLSRQSRGAQTGREFAATESAETSEFSTGSDSGEEARFAAESVNQKPVETGSGHIMKLRYTPMQLKCLAVEEESSSHHADIRNSTSIEGLPVIIGTLHSQLPAAAATIKEIKPDAQIAYIMTDGAALPLAFSNLVAELKTAGLIDTTLTIGHAFGGDFEAINIYSGLVAAKHAAKADIVVVCMGPGIVGTGTKLGFTGIEQGQIINAVNALNGVAIAIPRISFSDKRERHYGISHHTVTSLKLAAMSRATVTLPEMEYSKTVIVEDQLNRTGLREKHDVLTVDADVTIEALKRRGISPTTMGRGIDQEQEFFKAAGAAAICAVRYLKSEKGYR